MNFSNWVNRFRIEYFIEQVPENPQLTLEALSKKSGFISRSTFITAFKKEKGVTPREFFKEMKLSTWIISDFYLEMYSIINRVLFHITNSSSV